MNKDENNDKADEDDEDAENDENYELDENVETKENKFDRFFVDFRILIHRFFKFKKL